MLWKGILCEKTKIVFASMCVHLHPVWSIYRLFDDHFIFDGISCFQLISNPLHHYPDHPKYEQNRDQEHKLTYAQWLSETTYLIQSILCRCQVKIWIGAKNVKVARENKRESGTMSSKKGWPTCKHSQQKWKPHWVHCMWWQPGWYLVSVQKQENAKSWNEMSRSQFWKKVVQTKVFFDGNKASRTWTKVNTSRSMPAKLIKIQDLWYLELWTY